MEQSLKVRNSKIEDDIIIYNGGYTDVYPLNCIINKNRLMKKDLESIYKAKEGTNITLQELIESDSSGNVYTLIYKLINGNRVSRINIGKEEVLRDLDFMPIVKRGAIIFRSTNLESLYSKAKEEYDILYKRIDKTDTTKLYSATEFASLINVSGNTVRTWDNKGILKPSMVLPDGKRLYTYGQATEFIREHSTKPTKAICYVSSEIWNDDIRALFNNKIQELKCDEHEIIEDSKEEEIKDRDNIRYIIDKVLRGEVRYIVVYREDMVILKGEREIIGIIGEFTGVRLIIL